MSKAVFSKSIARESITNIVINRLTDGIISGDLKPGSKIPTELELSNMWQVGRNSVREAVKALVHIGVLEIRRSDGTYVASKFTSNMIHPLIYSLMFETHDSEALIELRQIFEVGVFQLAMQKANKEDLEKIKKAHDLLRKLVEEDKHDIKEILQAEIQFHTAIENSAHNALINRISSVITQLTIPSREETTGRLLTGGKGKFLIDVHRQMLLVLESHDESQILSTVTQHYIPWKEYFRK